MQKAKYSFDKNVSSQLKAFALVLMIMHHLWHRSYFALFENVYEYVAHPLVFYRLWLSLQKSFCRFDMDISGISCSCLYNNGVFIINCVVVNGSF